MTQQSAAGREQAICRATTGSGANCQRRVKPGATYCWQHEWERSHGFRAKFRSLSKNAPVLFVLAVSALVLGVLGAVLTYAAWKWPEFWSRRESRLEVTDVVGVLARKGNQPGFFLNVFYADKGALPVSNMAHRSIVVATEDMTQDEEERYKHLARAIEPPPPQPADEIQPGTPPKHYFTAPQDDTEISQLGAVAPDVLSGKKRLYLFVVMKYRDDALRNGRTRVTEFCGWFINTFEAWHNCGNRVYVTGAQ